MVITFCMIIAWIGVQLSTSVATVPTHILRKAFTTRRFEDVRATGLNMCESKKQVQNCISNKPLLTISHPKSGRTWLRCLVANTWECMHNNNSLELSETIHVSERVLAFSHGEPFHPFSYTAWSLLYAYKNYEPFQAPNGVLLVRDPRDVVVSSYYDRLYRDVRRWIMPWTTLSKYLRKKTGSLETLVSFLNIWSAVVERPGWVIIRYEDLHHCPNRALAHLLNERLCLGVSDACLQLAINRCNFFNLQHKADYAQSRDGGEMWKPANSNPNSRKVRRGEIGAYKYELTNEDIGFVEEFVAQNMAGASIFRYGKDSSSQLQHKKDE